MDSLRTFVIAVTILFSSCNSSDNTVDLAHPLTSPTPAPEMLAKLKNDEGWPVPFPPDGRRGPATKNMLVTWNHKEIEVEYTTLLHSGRHHFRLIPKAENHKSLLFDSDLRLAEIKEVRAGKNVFAYVIAAQKSEHAEQRDHNSSRSHPTYFILLDEDGDSKFETLLLSVSDSFVPRWATT